MLTQRLRHRIDIDQRVATQDAQGGESFTWSPWASKVPAEIAPLSAREFLAANQVHGEAVARITIRWREGLDPTMRIRHGSDVYNIGGGLPDQGSGRRHITIVVSRGVNAG